MSNIIFVKRNNKLKAIKENEIKSQDENMTKDISSFLKLLVPLLCEDDISLIVEDEKNENKRYMLHVNALIKCDNISLLLDKETRIIQALDGNYVEIIK